MTVVAHIAGVPMEESLVPLLASAGGIVIGLRAAVRRARGNLRP